MSAIYLLLLAGVCLVLCALLIEGVVAVSRKPPWAQPRPHLEAVDTVDRRYQDLPFVGADRRRFEDEEQPAAAATRRA